MPLHELDPELAPILARDALDGLDELLAGQPPGEGIQYRKIGALVRVISFVAASYATSTA